MIIILFNYKDFPKETQQDMSRTFSKGTEPEQDMLIPIKMVFLLD